MERPFVICHMLTSIDSKATGDWLMDKRFEKQIGRYFTLHEELKGDAFAIGKTTLLESFSNTPKPDFEKYKGKNVPYKDFIGKYEKKYFAVCFDRKGNCFWNQNYLINDVYTQYNNAHIIEVVTEQAPQEYLAYLQELNISYIIGGKDDTDLVSVLKKLKEYFGIEKFILEGGPTINSSFLKQGVIDELHFMVCPVVGNAKDKCVFSESSMSNFKLISTAIDEVNDFVLMRYKKI